MVYRWRPPLQTARTRRAADAPREPDDGVARAPSTFNQRPATGHRCCRPPDARPADIPRCDGGAWLAWVTRMDRLSWGAGKVGGIHRTVRGATASRHYGEGRGHHVGQSRVASEWVHLHRMIDERIASVNGRRADIRSTCALAATPYRAARRCSHPGRSPPDR